MKWTDVKFSTRIKKTIHKRGDILFKILKKVYIAMKGHIRSSGAQQKVKSPELILLRVLSRSLRSR